ncbi:hypothetical protein NW768_000983 [Fusarium equiseti]|uniref:Fucose-specific lectin n=1 Tax=Fusarium equiseti TaxID=61235 RepID=A0ABQ8RU28_FUSEQ|nr:hypothetical protein NW768_000983 [Fusarium equiseti]
MPDELHPLVDASRENPRSSMTLVSTLDDGTTIKLTVSPASTESSAVTASTTFTHTSFSFHISTTVPSNSLASHKAPTPPETHSCSVSSTSDRHPKHTSTDISLVNHPGPGNMTTTLPNDVVAIDTGEKSLLFYVAADPKGTYQLSYLESPDNAGNGSYTAKKIKRAKDRSETNEDDAMIDIKVSPNNKQVAAITWQGTQGTEIRVYYVDKENEHLREVCRTGNSGWYIGALSFDDDRSNKYEIRPNTSISASVHEYGPNNFNLRVFAAEAGETNKKGLHQISVFKFNRDESNKAASWQGTYITNAITGY